MTKTATSTDGRTFTVHTEDIGEGHTLTMLTDERGNEYMTSAHVTADGTTDGSLVFIPARIHSHLRGGHIQIGA